METDYDKIMKYLNGSLSGEERKQFEVELQINPELTEEVEIERALYEGGDFIFKRNTLLERIKKLTNEVEEEENMEEDSKPIIPWIWVRWVAAAAAVIAIIILVKGIIDKSADLSTITNQELAEAFNPQEKFPAFMGKDSNQLLIDSAIYYLEKSKFDSSGYFFEKFADFHKDTMLIQLESPRDWAGKSYALAENYDKAIFNYLKSEKLDDEQFTWKLILLYLKRGKDDDLRGAKVLVKKLIEDQNQGSDPQIIEKAQSLQKLLENK